MKAMFISLMEGFVWVAVVIFVIIGAMGGANVGDAYGFGGGVGGAFGVFVGLCASALLCGPAFLMLRMHDLLQKIEENGRASS